MKVIIFSFEAVFLIIYYNLFFFFSPRIVQIGSTWTDQRTLTLSMRKEVNPFVMDAFIAAFIIDQEMLNLYEESSSDTIWKYIVPFKSVVSVVMLFLLLCWNICDALF
ncbi:hypothetical protein ABZP36_026228 [Zizania latifolia]